MSTFWSSLDPTEKSAESPGPENLDIKANNVQAKPDPNRTSIYKKADINYQLKMKTSRAVFSEIQKKAGAFPFTLRALDDEKRARMGVQEAVAHGELFDAILRNIQLTFNRSLEAI